MLHAFVIPALEVGFKEGPFDAPRNVCVDHLKAWNLARCGYGAEHGPWRWERTAPVGQGSPAVVVLAQPRSPPGAFNTPSSTMSKGGAEKPAGSFQRGCCCAGCFVGELRRQWGGCHGWAPRSTPAGSIAITWRGLEQPPSFGAVVTKAPVKENSSANFLPCKCYSTWYSFLTCQVLSCSHPHFLSVR